MIFDKKQSRKCQLPFDDISRKNKTSNSKEDGKALIWKPVCCVRHSSSDSLSILTPTCTKHKRNATGHTSAKGTLSPYGLDNIIMTSYSKDSAIHFLWQIYSWAGEFSSLKKLSGGLWSWPFLPPTSMSVPFSSKNTVKNSLICATLEKNSTWVEREIKYSENAIKSSILKTSDFIQLIQLHLNYSPLFPLQSLFKQSFSPKD